LAYGVNRDAGRIAQTVGADAAGVAGRDAIGASAADETPVLTEDHRGRLTAVTPLENGWLNSSTRLSIVSAR
jgi:hypothetical protein